ncbi:MAG: hypothetical protein AAF497_07975, partial [Planctomycetota bacterium]
SNARGPAAQEGGPEIICIVRPRGGGESQAYVLDNPSESLISELSREMSRRSPHRNTGLRAYPRSSRKVRSGDGTSDSDWESLPR